MRRSLKIILGLLLILTLLLMCALCSCAPPEHKTSIPIPYVPSSPPTPDYSVTCSLFVDHGSCDGLAITTNFMGETKYPDIWLTVATPPSKCANLRTSGHTFDWIDDYGLDTPDLPIGCSREKTTQRVTAQHAGMWNLTWRLKDPKGTVVRTTAYSIKVGVQDERSPQPR